MWNRVNSKFGHMAKFKMYNSFIDVVHMWRWIQSTHGDVVIHQYNHIIIVRRPSIAVHLLVVYMYAFNIAIEAQCDINTNWKCVSQFRLVVVLNAYAKTKKTTTTTAKRSTKHINKTILKLLDCNQKHFLATDSSQFLLMALSGFVMFMWLLCTV